MQIKTIDLYKYFGVEKQENYAGSLTIYSHGLFEEISGNRLRPAILVLGGGGYQYVSEREKEPIALEYFAKGFDAFVLEYTVYPNGYFPSELIESCMAIKYIRTNAKDLHIIENKVCAIGFSAGGHLLGMLSNLSDIKEVTDVLGKGNYRPDASIYSYAVVMNNGKTHGGSIQNVSNGDKAIIERVAIDKTVTKKSPPAFIWCTANDGCVPSENSLRLALAYKKKNVPFELHIFEDGVHGLSTCGVETLSARYNVGINKEVSYWLPLSISWLTKNGFIIKD